MTDYGKFTVQLDGELLIPCPCTIADDPCMPDCTCLDSLSPRGCLCCARYGSEEQRRVSANKIVRLCRNYREQNREPE